MVFDGVEKHMVYGGVARHMVLLSLLPGPTYVVLCPSTLGVTVCHKNADICHFTSHGVIFCSIHGATICHFTSPSDWRYYIQFILVQSVI